MTCSIVNAKCYVFEVCFARRRLDAFFAKHCHIGRLGRLLRRSQGNEGRKNAVHRCEGILPNLQGKGQILGRMLPGNVIPDLTCTATYSKGVEKLPFEKLPRYRGLDHEEGRVRLEAAFLHLCPVSCHILALASRYRSSSVF